MLSSSCAAGRPRAARKAQSQAPTQIFIASSQRSPTSSTSARAHRFPIRATAFPQLPWREPPSLARACSAAHRTRFVRIVGRLQIDLAGCDAAAPRRGHESRCWIDGPDVPIATKSDRRRVSAALDRLHLERHLAEPDDMRAQPAAAATSAHIGALDANVLAKDRHGRRAMRRRSATSTVRHGIWMTRREPARSCRSSMFCVTSVRRSPRAANSASSRASAACAALGAAG